jgi:hypothetical protein
LIKYAEAVSPTTTTGMKASPITVTDTGQHRYAVPVLTGRYVASARRLQSTVSSFIVGGSLLTPTKTGVSDVGAVRRVVVSQLDSLLSLKDGWDGPNSVAVTNEALGGYSRFILLLGSRLRVDAEPMATPNGGIRMEWERGGDSYIAEIEGNGGTFLCKLAATPDDDREVELPYTDLDALVQFFEDGTVVD